MTYCNALKRGEEILKKAGVSEASLDTWLLLENVTKMTRAMYYLHQEDELSPEEENEFEAAIRKRAERIPLQYIIGKTEFMGLQFVVNDSVLIPRQDTEVLVESVLRQATQGMRILDLCTGSGCIAISIAKNVSQVTVDASDISKQALLVAKENGKNNDVTIEWIRSDLFDNITESYDIIVSNPPYIPTAQVETLMPEVRDYEPRQALDGEKDGLAFYRKIVAKAPEYLNETGRLFLEIGCEQAPSVTMLLKEHGFEEIEVFKDLAGLDRVVKGRKKVCLTN
jgi:release factor glutamine methyltransferase